MLHVFWAHGLLTSSARREGSNVCRAISTTFRRRLRIKGSNFERQGSSVKLRSGWFRLRLMEKLWVWCCYGVSAIIFSVSYAVSVFFLAIVGSTLGAFTGVLLGVKSQRGLFCSVAVGAISGGTFLINSFKTSIALWFSDECSFGDLLQWTDRTTELDAGELVQQFLYSLTLLRLEQTLAHADNLISEIAVDPAKVSKHSLNRIHRIEITEDHLMDSSGNRNSCSICLQDFECKDVARRLPNCRHLFHLRCIDKWISKQRSCPLCRCPIGQVN